MKGSIASWKEDKGFGFIRPDGRKDNVFVHISDIKKTIRAPQIGDVVFFELSQDAQGRARAVSVVLEGVALDARAPANRIVTEPVQKDALDYLAYLLIGVLLLVTAAIFIQSQSLERSAIPAAGCIAVFLWLSRRQKCPKNPKFSCAKCKSVASHDKRSVQAWNRGFTKLYCSACHKDWLRQQAPEPQQFEHSSASSGSSKSGCLGIVLALVLTPMLVTAGVAAWLM